MECSHLHQCLIVLGTVLLINNLNIFKQLLLFTVVVQLKDLQCLDIQADSLGILLQLHITAM